MQPHDPQNANNLQQPTVPQAPPAAGAMPGLTPTAADPGRNVTIWGLALSPVPVVGIILSAIGMQKSKEAGYSTKLGTIGVISGVVGTISVAIVLTWLIIGFVLVNQSITTLGNKVKDATSDMGNVRGGTDTSRRSAFGVELQQDRASVENVLGKPEYHIKNVDPCRTYIGSISKTLGYDTVCTYGIGEVVKNPTTGKSILPMTTVRYLDNKLVEASKVSPDGTLTSLSEVGVTEIKP